MQEGGRRGNRGGYGGILRNKKRKERRDEGRNLNGPEGREVGVERASVP